MNRERHTVPNSIADVYASEDEMNLFLARIEAGDRWTSRIIDSNGCKTKNGLFVEAASALGFPDYFGKNWDAFQECMNDREEWLSPGNYLLVFTDADQLLCSDTEKNFETLMNVLTRATKDWNEGINNQRLSDARREEYSGAKPNLKLIFQINPNKDLPENFKNWVDKTHPLIVSPHDSDGTTGADGLRH